MCISAETLQKSLSLKIILYFSSNDNVANSLALLKFFFALVPFYPTHEQIYKAQSLFEMSCRCYLLVLLVFI